jgi:hypothetical protein
VGAEAVSRPGYIRIANDIGASEEALALPDELYLPALGLFVLMLGYCDRQLTDGLIPDRAVSRAIAPGLDCDEALTGLERVGLLERNGKGWKIPGYLKWQRSRKDIEAASIAASKAAGSRWRNADRNAECNAKRNADRNAKEIDRQIDRKNARGRPVDNSTVQAVSRPVDPPCRICGKPIPPAQLADEKLTTGDGYAFWHIACEETSS